MREILFRGKTDKGEWVHGDLLHPDLYGHGYSIEDFAKEKNNCFDVIPETVGQYTGLTDKNGKKIFEGDIVGYDGELYYDVYCIIFVDGCFRIAKNGKYSYTLHNLHASLEIIGNIHDNPELLKGGEG